jgi:hypothetical protein
MPNVRYATHAIVSIAEVLATCRGQPTVLFVALMAAIESNGEKGTNQNRQALKPARIFADRCAVVACISVIIVCVPMESGFEDAHLLKVLTVAMVKAKLQIPQI